VHSFGQLYSIRNRLFIYNIKIMGGKGTGWMVLGSSASGDKFFLFLKSPDISWPKTSRLFKGCRGSFLQIKLPKRVGNHSPSTSAEVKNGWNYTPLPSVSSWCGQRQIYLQLTFTSKFIVPAHNKVVLSL
jgi:hypothetical protein